MRAGTQQAVGFGVIGCGVVADYHIHAIQHAAGARLAAVSDVVEERARQTGTRCGVPWFTDYHAMLALPDVHVVCICTPSGLRIPAATDAAAAGKHLVIEKPIDISLENADRILAAAAAAGVQVMCIFQLRYGQAVRHARRAVQAGKLGRMVLGDAYIKWHRPQEYYDSASWRGTWRTEGGGALMTQGIHTVDLLHWIMGPVQRVSARMATLVHRIEVEDSIVATVEYASGALGVIEATTAVRPGTPARLEFLGSQGTIVIEADRIVTWEVPGEPAPAIAPQASEVAKAAADPRTFGTEGHQLQIQEMVRVVTGGEQPAVDGQEGRRTLELVLAIYQAARTGATVELPLRA